MRKSINKLTNHELNFASDTSWPLLKRSVLEKVQEELHDFAKALALSSELLQEYKISKGDNLQGVPYLVLDTPRMHNGFTWVCRTLFWWGHHISQTILINRSIWREAPLDWIGQLGSETRILIQEDAIWEPDITSESYMDIGQLQPHHVQQLGQAEWIKVGKVIAITDIAAMEAQWIPFVLNVLKQSGIKKGA